MPIYEYECDNKHRFEVIQKFDDAPVSQCTVCGSPVQKLPSSPAIQFKGTGWYITDYGRKGDSSSSGSSSGSSGSSAKSEKSSDAPSETSTKEKAETPTAAKETKDTAPSK